MHPITFNDFADSPTLLLSPQHQPHHPHYPFFAASSSAHTYRYHSYVPIMPPNPTYPGTSPKSRASPIPIPASASKKRRRNSTSIETSLGASAPDNDIDMQLLHSRTPAISPEPASGEPMAIINPLTGQQASPESSTGAWFETKLTQGLLSGPKKKVAQMEPPEDESVKRKCLGLGEPSTMSHIPIELLNTESAKWAMVGNSSESQTPTIQDSEIDEYARLLGVGWISLGKDPDVLAALRGYSRYIENHYPLNNVVILVRGKSLESYLIRSSEGYFLFKEDLKEGRLIAKDISETLIKLRSPDIQFDSAGPIYAADSPDPLPSNDNGSDVEMDDRTGGNISFE